MSEATKHCGCLAYSGPAGCLVDRLECQYAAMDTALANAQYEIENERLREALLKCRVRFESYKTAGGIGAAENAIDDINAALEG